MEKTIDGTRYKVMRLPDPLLVHWIVNPGLAINELIFGQRMPAEWLIEQDTDRPLGLRQYVQCPSCQTVTNYRRWVRSKQRFGNWFGLACPSCAGKIPTLLNLFSRLVVLLLYPVLWPIRRRFEANALARNAEKLRAVPDIVEGNEAVGRPAVAAGIKFGVAMALIFWVQKGIGGDLDGAALLFGLAKGAGCGLAFGILMAIFSGHSPTR